MPPLADYELVTYSIKSRLGKVMEILDAEVGDVAGRVILDAGCNNGRYHFGEYEARGLKVVGIDISRDYLTASRSSNPNGSVHLLRGDVKDLPLSSESVDIVLLGEVLEHLNTPEQALGEAYRVLKKGGYIFVDVPWLCEVYRPLSAIILRNLSRFKRERTPPLPLRILFKNLDEIDSLSESAMLKRRSFAALVIGLLRLFPTFRAFEPEYLVYNYYHGKMPEGDMHLQFRFPGEWTEDISRAGFEVSRKTGALITPYPFDRLRVGNMLLSKLEHRLGDNALLRLSQILVIAATKA